MVFSRKVSEPPTLIDARAGVMHLAEEIKETNLLTLKVQNVFEKVIAAVQVYRSFEAEHIDSRLAHYGCLKQSLQGRLRDQQSEELKELIALMDVHIKQANLDKQKIVCGSSFIKKLFFSMGIDLNRVPGYLIYLFTVCIVGSRDRIRTLFYEIHPHAILDSEVAKELGGNFLVVDSYAMLENMLKEYARLNPNPSVQSLAKGLTFAKQIAWEMEQARYLGIARIPISEEYRSYWIGSIAYKIEKMISELKEGEICLIPSGWQGHAIVHEVKRESDKAGRKVYSLIVDNGGEEMFSAGFSGRGTIGKVKEAMTQGYHLARKGTLRRVAFGKMGEGEFLKSHAFSTIVRAWTFETNDSSLQELYAAFKKNRAHAGECVVQQRESCTYNGPKMALSNNLDKDTWTSLETFIQEKSRKELARLLRSYDPRSRFKKETMAYLNRQISFP